MSWFSWSETFQDQVQLSGIPKLRIHLQPLILNSHLLSHQWISKNGKVWCLSQTGGAVEGKTHPSELLPQGKAAAVHSQLLLSVIPPLQLLEDVQCCSPFLPSFSFHSHNVRWSLPSSCYTEPQDPRERNMGIFDFFYGCEWKCGFVPLNEESVRCWFCWCGGIVKVV